MSKKILVAILVIIIIIVTLICFIVFWRLNDEDFDDDIEYVNESGVEYDSSQLNNFDFQLINIPQEFEDENIDLEAVNIKVKEYLYKKGLVTATIGEVSDYKSTDNNIQFTVDLNDEKNTKIKITINKE